MPGRPITRVVAIGRLGAALVPTSNTVAQEGDLLYVSVAIDAVGDFHASLDAPVREAH